MKNKIFVTCSSMPTLEEYVSEIRDIWDTHNLTNMGTKHQKLENELKDYLKVKEIELFVNGHMALELSLQALNLQGEVITTPFTFASTTHAIIRNGLEPVFCDINPWDYTIDADKIESLITDKTCAIMPVHVYGNICNVEKIEQIGKKYNLKIIYDAAHTFGETYKGKGIGTYGDISCFSFHATKVFNSIEGGAACFHDERLGKILYSLKNFGIKDAETVDGIGANAKMNEFQAAMGLCNLKNIDREIKKRKRVDERYREHLENIPGLQLNYIYKDVEPNYAYFPVIFHESEFGASRNEVFAELAKNGIFARKYFYPLTNSFECFHNKYNLTYTPTALHISKRVLTLPMYADLELEKVDLICDIILKMKK